ncbi:DUF1795 domain-containing protein [Escherichia coli]
MQYLINEGHFTLPETGRTAARHSDASTECDCLGRMLLLPVKYCQDGGARSITIWWCRKSICTELSKMVFTVEERCRVQERPAEDWEFSWDNKGVMIQQLPPGNSEPATSMDAQPISTQALAEEDRKSDAAASIRTSFRNALQEITQPVQREGRTDDGKKRAGEVSGAGPTGQ